MARSHFTSGSQRFSCSGVGDLEASGVVRLLPKRERRVAVRLVRPVRVEPDAPGPAKDADVEVEDPAWVAAREEDHEAGDERQDRHRDPEQRERDVVRDREEPFDEPEPSAHAGLELAVTPTGYTVGAAREAAAAAVPVAGTLVDPAAVSGAAAAAAVAGAAA